MKLLPSYTDYFISPFTGSIASFTMLPTLTEDYVWEGNSSNEPYPSPVLIDMRLFSAQLKNQVDEIAASTFITQTPNTSYIPNAQPLSALSTGLLKSTTYTGIVSIAIPFTDYMGTTLTSGKIWIGNSMNHAVESAYTPVSNLLPFILKTVDLLVTPNAQGLDSLSDGVMVNTDGIVSTSSLYIQFSGTSATSGNIAIFSGSSGELISDSGSSIPNLEALVSQAEDAASKSLAYSILSSNYAESAGVSAGEAGASAAGALASAAAALTYASSAAGSVADAESYAAASYTSSLNSAASATAAAGSASSASSSASSASSSAASALASEIQCEQILGQIYGVGINLFGDISGFGTIGYPIYTTLNLTLDTIKPPQSNVTANSYKITNLANGTAANDAVNFSQISGTVTSVTGSGNIASSGGITPNITFTGILPIANGGTNQSTYTLGDTLYSSATNTLSKLSGNTGSTIKYLAQTGTGTVSAPPAWTTISGGDITGAALTKTDDTNVTLTLGGSPSTALLMAASLTLGWTGQLSLARGGTNATLTASANGLIYSTSSAMAILATANNGTLVTSSGGIPSISSTLPTAVQSNITQLGAQSQALNMNTNQINALTDPTSAQDAATKNYVDSLVAGLNPAESVKASTTSTLTVIYNNGVVGVGATLTNAGTQAIFSIDGQSPSANARVLIKNQSSSFQNGIYIVTAVGSSSTNWVLTRSGDFNSPANMNSTGIVPVINGTTNGNTAWLLTSIITTVGTDAITFTQFGVSFPVSLSNGGTGASLTASNGGIVYSTGSSLAILGGTSTANQLMISGASSAPSWVSFFVDDANLNNFIGTGCGKAGLSTSQNTGMGVDCFLNIVAAAGSSNTGFGCNAFNALNAGGGGNTAIGDGAGSSQARYTYCTFIGSVADATVNNLTNATAIGYSAVVSASNCLVLGDGANVGIGTSAPVSLLTLNNPSTAPTINSVLNINSNSSNFSRISLTGQSYYTGGPTSNEGVNINLAYNTSGNRQVMFSDSAQAKNTTNSAIRIGISGLTHSGAYIDCISTDLSTALPLTLQPSALYVSTNSVYTPSGGSWLSSSDSRIKKDIQRYNRGLNEVLQLKPVQFRFNKYSGYSKEIREKLNRGLIADDVKKVMPECVGSMKNKKFGKIKSLDVNPITYAMINAIKELNKKVEDLKNAA